MDRCSRSALSHPRIKSADNNNNTHQKFFLFFLRRLVVEATRLNDLVIDIKLETCSRVHGFFHALLRDKGTKSALLLDTFEGLEFNGGANLPMGGSGRMRQCDWSLNDLVVIRIVLSWLCKVRWGVGSG